VRQVSEIELFANSDNPVTITSPTDTSKSFQLTENSTLTGDIYPGKRQKVQSKKWEHISLPAKPIGAISLLLDRKDMSDIWVMMKWTS
jgi:hypothetical protein